MIINCTIENTLPNDKKNESKSWICSPLGSYIYRIDPSQIEETLQIPAVVVKGTSL